MPKARLQSYSSVFVPTFLINGFQIFSAIQAGCKEGDVLNISIERDPEANSQAK